MVIATGFALIGFWPILPFAGLELLALGGALYYVTRDTHECEVVTVRGDTVLVEKGRGRPEHSWNLSRHWAGVELRPGAARWHPSQLLIRSHGRGVELGRFLTERERRDLARQLASVIGAA